MNRTEKFVFNLCNKTFLSLWSFLSPLGKKEKELCDILVICEPDIIIFSVKEIFVDVNDEHGRKRWLKRAIQESAKQIYGAERFVKTIDEITLNDRTTKIRISKSINWNIHRVAVAFGRGDKLPIAFGDFGKGFVHVFDERSIQVVMHELDTVKDFIEYLTRKENFCRQDNELVYFGEEDLIAYYISNDFSFPKGTDCLIFDGNVWESLRKDKDYLSYREDLKISYQWDNLIDILIKDFRNDNLINKTKRDDLELTLRHMARERRESRRLLGEQFIDFIGVHNKPTAQARIIKSNENPNLAYMFLLGEYKDRDTRAKELQLRCFVARYKTGSEIVVGIATEKYNPKGFSLDFCYSYLPEFTEEMIEGAKRMMKDLGYFKSPIERKIN